METYNVVISERAFNDLDKIYTYLASKVMAVNAAINTVDKIQTAILSLEKLPKRGSERKIGRYKSKGYLQLFVGTYIIVYRVEEHKKQVVIITIQNMRQSF
ncbi:MULTISPECIES: type II toxin-antitoxin system RelE/ParE family toxin [unclassified Gemella]|uniref:type II toxin-antitoxin system RelE/ParE family toxin n=1 Tax=unclassified Gemella TaxID=2624949 RepID=UPI001072FC28|nr:MULTISPECIES: type II toxin-antitoxin system RelE/ParE family toxin [unclassified Gemella]MBF0710461.1 type II toxin-antitoxin system RelE/ParE family toxin [Gemella sp. GL1.1]MBF0746597.1 type II toxin-antitoxin system RelE/ParE family toxin [Gemella sp. 19428wG2_WT2a]NYS27805.1 type II toxin-antitoxin system RelE/ParE family toxin [Gemella sp. GL1]TFU59952.1 type II toxin-antitoxin system RelE/ParE family toxin [Gemella sp. WT2a]